MNVLFRIEQALSGQFLMTIDRGRMRELESIAQSPDDDECGAQNWLTAAKWHR
jgi:hypothetical protein